MDLSSDFLCLSGGICGRSVYSSSMKVDDVKLVRKIGKEIRLRRKALKWSQEKLAELARLNPKYLSEVERGRSGPGAATLLRIALALKVTPNDLLDVGASAENTHDPRILSEKLFELLKGKPKLQLEFIRRLVDDAARHTK